MTATTARSDRLDRFSPLLDRSAEPLGFAAGDTNVTRYVGNGSTNAADPSGLYPEAFLQRKEPPKGTADNGYNGVGSWTFGTEEEALEFFQNLLKPDQNNFPDEWVEVAKDGCIGLATLRAGWGGGRKPPNPLFIPGASWTTSFQAAQQELAKLEKANPGKQYMIISAQLPVTGNPATVAQNLGGGGLITNITSNPALNQNIDLNRAGDFNFGSWFPTEGGGGYWEYMNHRWSQPGDFAPGKCPRVEHQQSLPDLGKNFLTLYGIVELRPFK